MPRAKQQGQRFSWVMVDDPSDLSADRRSQIRSHVARVQHQAARERRRSQEISVDVADKGRSNDWCAVENSKNGRGDDLAAGADAPPGPWHSHPHPHSATPGLAHHGNMRARSTRRDEPRDLPTTGHGGAQSRILPRPDQTDALAVVPAFEALIRSGKLATTVTRASLFDDPADNVGKVLGRLQLDASAALDHYRWIVAMQSPDFERQCMQHLAPGSGYQTLLSGIADDPALIATSVLIATGHLMRIRNSNMSPQVARCIFELRSFVMNNVQLAIQDPKRSLSDALLVAIAILASHEGLQGSHLNYHIHMRGLMQMISLRGGFDALASSQEYLGAFLAWHDANVSTIMGNEPYTKLGAGYEKLPKFKPRPMMWLLMEC